jgi:outer membrane protein OmpA-like peptidoglycan-associated protein
MSAQNDDGTGVALGAGVGVIVLVLGLVFGIVMHQHNNKKAVAMAKAAAPAAPAAAAAAPAAAASSAAPAGDAASVMVENGVVKFYFAPGKAELAQDGAKALTDILAAAKTGKKIGISGFVDPSGDPQKNAELAKERAFAVKELLTSSGVPDGQIVMVRPNDIKAGATSAAEGRRVEVFLP